MKRLIFMTLYCLSCAAPLAAQEFTTLKGHGGPVMGLDVAPTGQMASASFDNSVGLWTDRTPLWLEGHDAAVIDVTFAGRDLLLTGGDDFRVIAWHLDTGAHQTIVEHKGKVADIAYDAKRGLIATASWDGSIALRFVRTDAQGQTVFEEGPLLKGHAAGVNAVAFAKEGLFSASSDGSIRLWDIATGQSRAIVKHGFGVNALVVDPEGDWLAYGAVDGGTRIVAPFTGATLADLTLDRRPILAMAHHAPTHQLAVGDGHGFIMMVDTKTRAITRDFRATRRGPIWALAFSQGGETVFAGGLDDVVYGWPVALMDRFAPQMGQDRSFLQAPETMPNGERQFMRKCSICHALEPGASRKAGPTLHALFGRRAGTVPGYAYSPILRGSEIVWSDDTIDQLFDLGPDHYIPGSKMPMQRITSARDRLDLIAFLKSYTHLKEQKP